MSATTTIRDGQIGRTVRLRTGLDLTDSTARIVRVKNGEEATETVTGVPFDAAEPTDLLLAIEEDVLDAEGVWAVEVEVQFNSGAIVLKHDGIITVDVETLDPE